jgi:hypothetical protein
MLLSDAIKKPRKKAAKQQSKQAAAPAPVAPVAPPAPAARAIPSVGQVTDFLRSMVTQTGGQTQRVTTQPDMQGGVTWFVEPWNRQRLDHYVGRNYHPDEDDDPEGWDSEGWEEEYAGPLRRQVQAYLDSQFGKGRFSVDIGEKGHIYVDRA